MRKFNLQIAPILFWSSRQKLCFVGVVGGLFLSSYCLFFGHAMIYLHLKADAVRLLAQCKMLKLSKIQLIDLKSRVESLDLDLQAVTKTLELQDLPSFTRKVDLLAIRASLRVTGWRTLSTQHHPLYNEIELQLSVNGTYTACVSFLKDLLRLRQVLYVDDVSIERIVTGSGWRLGVMVKVYQPLYLPVVHLSDSMYTDALDFLGLLKQGQRIWGVICLPGGKITHVQVGDYVGKVLGNVTRINAHAIWFATNQHFVLHSKHSLCRILPYESRS